MKLSKKLFLIAGFSLVTITCGFIPSSFAYTNACVYKVRSLESKLKVANNALSRAQAQLDSAQNRLTNLQTQSENALTGIRSQEESYKSAANFFAGECLIRAILGSSCTSLLGQQMCANSPQECGSQALTLQGQLASITAQRRSLESSWSRKISNQQTQVNRLTTLVATNQNTASTAQTLYDNANNSCINDVGKSDCINSAVNSCTTDLLSGCRDQQRQCSQDLSECYTTQKNCSKKTDATCVDAIATCKQTRKDCAYGGAKSYSLCMKNGKSQCQTDAQNQCK